LQDNGEMERFIDKPLGIPQGRHQIRRMLRYLPKKLLRNAVVRVLPLFAVVACASFAPQLPDLTQDSDVVVLLHGLGRSPSAMHRLERRFEQAGFQVANLGYDSLNDTPEEILADITAQLDACCMDKTPQVHFVGHSLGGLIIRAYLEEQDVENLGRAVLLGTPNAGTEYIDNGEDRWWYAFLGPTGTALGTGADSFPNSLPAPDYPLGVIAGRTDRDNEDELPGEDDGLVTVESTRLDGMADFILLDVTHWELRSNAAVADQAIAFLRTGSFIH